MQEHELIKHLDLRNKESFRTGIWTKRYILISQFNLPFCRTEFISVSIFINSKSFSFLCLVI